MKMEQRGKYYWTQRSHDFGTVRKNEPGNEMGEKWLREMQTHLPGGKPLHIPNVGTGFFAELLAQQEHRVRAST